MRPRPDVMHMLLAEVPMLVMRSRVHGRPQRRAINAAEVVMIEDNAGDVLLMRLALDEAGVRANLHVAEDSLRAFALMDVMDDVPSLVVLDLNLPRVGGREILAQIRRGSRWQDVPVVVLSSSESQSEMESCMMEGASAYKVKPALFDDYVVFARSLVVYLL